MTWDHLSPTPLNCILRAAASARHDLGTVASPFVCPPSVSRANGHPPFIVILGHQGCRSVDKLCDAYIHLLHVKNRFRILNRFLIEGEAFDGHRLSGFRNAVLLPGASLGRRPSRKIPESPNGWQWKSPRTQCLTVVGDKMVLFSRSFIRKRVISLATTASVTATSFALAQDPMRAYHVRGAIPIQYVADRPGYASEQSFLSENAAAMNKMMADMTIKPTGDVDRDFVAMMVPHHQGAVDMANAELKYGHNEQLRRLAQQIVAMQQQEIKVMQDAVSDGSSTAQPRAKFSAQSIPTDGAVAHGGMQMKMSQ